MTTVWALINAGNVMKIAIILLMKSKIFKILIWSLFVVLVYYIVFYIIIYFDPTNTNKKGLKSLSSFVSILASYFFGSFLVKK